MGDWGYNFTARSGVMGPYLQLENLLCLEIFCVQTKNHRNERGESKKKKTHHGKKEGISFQFLVRWEDFFLLPKKA